MAETLTNPRMVLTGSNPSTVSVGDFNGDGKPDLAYLDAGFPSILHILLGNGDGTFQHGQDIPLPVGLRGAITVADVNNDGRQDLLIGGGVQFQAQVGALLGVGDGTFGPVIISNFATTITAFADIPFRFGVADFNGDGAKDLIVLDPLNRDIFVLLGNNTGAFTLKSILGNLDAPVLVLTGDFNGDGHPDFLVRNGLGNDVSVYLGNGDGTFKTGVTYPNIGSVVLADMDGDGHVDMVVTGPGNQVEIFHGNPDGTFATTSSGGTTLPGSNSSVIGVADFNGDAILDLAVVSNTGLSILLGKGNLTYGAPTPFVAGPAPVQFDMFPVLADFNLDGHIDFAAPAPGGIVLLLGNSDGTFQSVDTYTVDPGIAGFAVADFNKDQDPDIVVGLSTSGARILLGTGTGKFTLSPATIQAPAGFFSLVAGDFNGDGSADVLSLNAKTILFGNGDGTFSTPFDLSLIQPGITIAGIGDLNHDGRADILAAPKPQSIEALLGQSTNTFNSVTTTFPFSLDMNGTAAFADFNHDGNLDVVFAGSLNLQPLLGNGEGTFKPAPPVPTSMIGPFLGGPGIVAAADLDGDGKIDLIATLGFSPYAEVCYGKGDGTFEPPVLLPLSRPFLQLAVADMNADGKPDLVLANAEIISVIHNNGARSFGPEVYYVAGNVGSMTVQDLNRDGLPDIVVQSGPGLSVLLNQAGKPTLTGTLAASPKPLTFGQPLTVTLTLTPTSGTGAVTFSVDDRPIAYVPVSAGVATFTASDTSAFAAGAHRLSALYSGDTSFTPGLFTLPLNVVPVVHATSVNLTASPNPAVASQTVHFSFSVSSAGPIPTGTVAIHDGTTTIGSIALDPTGAGVFDSSLLGPGTHNITALYDGDINSAPSTSNAVSVVVNTFATTTSLTVLPSAPSVGSSFALSATVASASGSPTGSVSFFDGTRLLGSRELDSSDTAMLVTIFSSPGTHSFTASYNANGPFAASVSAAHNLSPTGAAATSRTFDLSILQDPSGDRFLLTVNVEQQAAVAGERVVFFASNLVVGEASLNSAGTATLEVAGVFPGSHYFTAVLQGANHFASSAATTLVGSPISGLPEFAMLLSSARTDLTASRPALLQLEIEPINGFGGQIQLTCSRSAEMSCSFQPASLSGGGKSTVTVMLVPQTSSSAFRRPHRYLLPGVTGAWALFSLLAFRRRRQRISGFLLGLICLAAAAGCGGKGPTPIEPSTIRIIASSSQAATPLSHSVTMNVSIH